MADHLNALAVTAVLQYFVILIACRCYYSYTSMDWIF